MIYFLSEAGEVEVFDDSVFVSFLVSDLVSDLESLLEENFPLPEFRA